MFVASLLLSVLPQVSPGGDLQLPPRPPQAATAEERPLDEIDRFRRDLLEMQGPSVRVEQVLGQMGHDYPDIEALILQVVRTANAPELRNLMPVARRYGRTSGTARVADELLFQLLARRLGPATQLVVDTMAFLKGSDAKAALRQCVRAEIPTVRHAAVAALCERIDAEDLPFALQLSREQALDAQLRGVDLLQALASEPAIARLVELLSKRPELAAPACTALIAIGEAAVPALQRRAAEAAVDRSSAYAAFALAQVSRGDDSLLPEELFARLRPRLKAPEPLTRCLAAVPLADLAFRSAPGSEQSPDRELVDALLLVVEPQQFVPNLDMLRGPAEQRLRRLTGRAVAEGLSWREWWGTQRDSFLGVRANVVVDERNAARALVTLVQRQGTVRVLGEGLAELPPRDGAIDVLLTGEQLLALVQELHAGGYGDPAMLADPSGLQPTRSLQLQVPGGRTSVAVSDLEHPAFDALAGVVQACVERELWQLFRLVQDEPDRAAFWRSERRWLEANPDPIQRGNRFVQRALRGWAVWTEPQRARAIAFVAAHPQRVEILREQDGLAAIEALRARPQLGEYDQQLLELVANVGGDVVWRECVAMAVGTGDRESVRRVFRVLGADAVLTSLGSEDAAVRRAALDEIVATRDQRASPRVIEMLGDADADVQRAAAFACGQLRAVEASRPLVALIAAEETAPLLRRECLRALGRVGGDLAFSVLSRAVTAPTLEDKEAALRGLGELQDPRAAHLLAGFLVVGGGKEFGELARFHLQRMGAPLAVPALRAQLPLAKDEELHADLVLMLGMFQDPGNVPDLMDLLRTRRAADAAHMLEGTTGVELGTIGGDERIDRIERWYRESRQMEQWQWFLAALQENEVKTTLRPEHFGADQRFGAIPELARLLVELNQPRLWVLCSAVLRSAAGQDFGVVTQQMPPDVREGIAARYRVLAESTRAAQRR
ncbi:MAG: HEAT repeat domain-containing protein [Planctomycetes bacterium]|nr:HEAT repeat domain-containing protein [Planctomycetota bacterium]